jgi:LAS superfamily LD-carboxypeptidase LdcB
VARAHPTRYTNQMGKDAVGDDTHVLTGQTEAHLAPLPGSGLRLHQAVVAPFERLRGKAFKAGFELEIVSSFRGFDAQLKIWNLKATGQRPLLDAAGKPLDFGSLSPKQIVYAILHWSALPGASRHHWGTDIDVIDRLSVPPRYQIQLTPAEANPGGMFATLHDWLDRHMDEEGFYRPYQKDLGGVQPERWHLSHVPTAAPLFEKHSADHLRATLQAAPIELKQVVLAELDEIFDRFFRRISDAPGTRKS